MSTETQDKISELFSAYSAGTLDPAYALMVETQASLRADIADELAISEDISSACFDDEPLVEMADRALEQTLEKINALSAKQSTTGFTQRAVLSASEQLAEFAALPEPLIDHAALAMAESGWKPSAPGISYLTLDMPSEAEVELYRIEPNRAVPRHSHGGSEYTLVVAGGFTDETGSYGPGDLSVKGPEDVHQPVADDGHVCYALAVRDGELRLTGMLGVLQRLFGK